MCTPSQKSLQRLEFYSVGQGHLGAGKPRSALLRSILLIPRALIHSKYCLACLLSSTFPRDNSISQTLNSDFLICLLPQSP